MEDIGKEIGRAGRKEERLGRKEEGNV